MYLSRRIQATVLVAIILVALIGASVSCSESERAGDGERDDFGELPATVLGFKVSRGAAAGYVPDVVCKECHEDIWKSYQAVGMSRSFYPPSQDNVIEKLGEPFHHKVTGRYYVMQFRDGKLYQARYMLDPQGKRYAELEVEVAWIIGSGNHVRTYLAQTELGELYELPLSWYAESGWGMSPGYDAKEHHRFERLVNRHCMFCHNALPEVAVGADLDHRPFGFPKKMPHGIGCQRCHGPGARHIVVAADEDADDAEIRRSIVNPSRLSKQQQADLCMTCHLQPEVHGEFLPRVFDKPMYSHRPGDDLNKLFVAMDHGNEAERKDRFQINHHAYRLRWSRCHTESDGALGCTTCHDPHRKVPKAERSSHYRKKCLQCHELADCQMEEMGSTRDPASSDCTSCHMFEARPADVVHVTMTDHWIRKTALSPDPAAPRKEEPVPVQRFDLLAFFPEREPQGNLFEVYAGLARVEGKVTQQDLDAWKRAFEKTKPHKVGAYIAVGAGLARCGDFKGAIGILTEAVEKFPTEAKAHYLLGDTLRRDQQSKKAIARLQEARRLDPNDPGTHRSLADSHAFVGEWREARTAYEETLRLRPLNARSWRHYAFCLANLRQPEAAAKAFERTIAMDPGDGLAFQGLADMYKQLGREAESSRILELKPK